MKILYRTKQLILLFGDLTGFIFAFWISFLIRNLTAPTPQILTDHALLFGVLFLFWIIINYINGCTIYHILKADSGIAASRKPVSCRLSLALFCSTCTHKEISPQKPYSSLMSVLDTLSV